MWIALFLFGRASINLRLCRLSPADRAKRVAKDLRIIGEDVPEFAKCAAIIANIVPQLHKPKV